MIRAQCIYHSWEWNFPCDCALLLFPYLADAHALQQFRNLLRNLSGREPQGGGDETELQHIQAPCPGLNRRNSLLGPPQMGSQLGLTDPQRLTSLAKLADQPKVCTLVDRFSSHRVRL